MKISCFRWGKMGEKVTEKCQGAYPILNEKKILTYRVHKANRLYWLKGRWIQLPDLLLASKLVYPLLALPCTKLKIASAFLSTQKSLSKEFENLAKVDEIQNNSWLEKVDFLKETFVIMWEQTFDFWRFNYSLFWQVKNYSLAIIFWVKKIIRVCTLVISYLILHLC